jgi:biopolymer transport protein ExbD
MAGHREHDPQLETDLGRVIVPMLDMSFQLLFFFVATFNPGKAEGKMALNLPATGQAKAKDLANVDPKSIPDVSLEIPSDFVVVVSSHEDSFGVSLKDSDKTDKVGEARGLTPQNRREEVNKLLETLREKLADKLKAKQDKEGPKTSDNIKIEANKKTKHADLVAVMDACIRAGYSQVGFAPPPDFQQQ